jgi:mannose-6-phosphate isomerase-like protein (cupin superfamily)
MSVEGMTQNARAVHAGIGDAVWFTNNLMTLKATAETTGGAYGLVEALAPAGTSPPLHVQHGEDETFYVLEGELTFRCGDETIATGPGACVFIPRGAPHTFVVEGDAPARFLSMCTPGGFERFFVAAGSPAEYRGLPPEGPPDVAKLKRVSEEFGAEIIGPPMTPRGR